VGPLSDGACIQGEQVRDKDKLERTSQSERDSSGDTPAQGGNRKNMLCRAKALQQEKERRKKGGKKYEVQSLNKHH
jgi:hypothetical protein